MKTCVSNPLQANNYTFLQCHFLARGLFQELTISQVGQQEQTNSILKTECRHHTFTGIWPRRPAVAAHLTPDSLDAKHASLAFAACRKEVTRQARSTSRDSHLNLILP